MKDRIYQAHWRSPKAEQRFRQLEDALWSDALLNSESLDVPTSFGPTRAYHWPGSGEPILFLHGIGGTSVIWTRYAAALPDRDVYAIDIMGDVGRSHQQVAYQSTTDMATWLDEALSGLGLHRVHLVGHSLGGFVALNAAVHRPSRVASLVLLDPVGIGKLSIVKFMLWGLPILLGSLAPAFVRRWLARKFRMPLLENKTAMRLALHGQLHHPPRFPTLDPFSDEELSTIDVPVALLVGAKTEMFDANEIMDRARRLIPALTAELVPNAGHALTLSHLNHCRERIDHATRPPTDEIPA